MLSRIFIIVFICIILVFSSVATAQEQQRYRVEVLVLQHLRHAEAGQVTDALRDYSSALDLRLAEEEEEILCPPDTLADAADAAGDPAALEAEPDAVRADLRARTLPDLDALEEAPDPNAVVLVEEMGPEMADAWRRLRLSGPFRPLQYLAWEQGNQEPFPRLRMHSEEIAWVDDPYEDMRAALAEEQDAAAAPDADPCDPAFEKGAGPIEHAANALPDPISYYELDGQVSLERRRFLHLNLDFELRERIETADTAAAPSTREASPQWSPGRRALPSLAQRARPEFRVYAMEQARQVRSGRMEYFDGPVIGVLAWITPIAVAEPTER